MTAFANQNQENRGVNWLAVIRILLAQVLLLLALSGAIIGYIEWSSDAAWAEFSASSKSQASEPGFAESRTRAEAVAGNQAACIRTT
jgi:hypothetical protein